jgi:hypothetical protein
MWTKQNNKPHKLEGGGALIVIGAMVLILLILFMFAKVLPGYNNDNMLY